VQVAHLTFKSGDGEMETIKLGDPRKSQLPRPAAAPVELLKSLSSKFLYCPEAFYFLFFSCLGAE
jgi:hypothetical protein